MLVSFSAFLSVDHFCQDPAQADINKIYLWMATTVYGHNAPKHS